MIQNPIPVLSVPFRGVPSKGAALRQPDGNGYLLAQQAAALVDEASPCRAAAGARGSPEAKKARWKTPSDIKALHRSASLVGEDRVVFDIGGNKYRFVVAVSSQRGSVFVRYVGTHNDYGRIDVAKI